MNCVRPPSHSVTVNIRSLEVATLMSDACIGRDCNWFSSNVHTFSLESSCVKHCSGNGRCDNHQRCCEELVVGTSHHNHKMIG